MDKMELSIREREMIDQAVKTTQWQLHTVRDSHNFSWERMTDYVVRLNGFVYKTVCYNHKTSEVYVEE